VFCLVRRRDCFELVVNSEPFEQLVRPFEMGSDLATDSGMTGRGGWERLAGPDVSLRWCRLG